jgi:hypothetical protein
VIKIAGYEKRRCRFDVVVSTYHVGCAVSDIDYNK